MFYRIWSLRVLALVAMLGATGCATGYHASGFSGGFQQTKLGNALYQVRFQGNGYTGQETVSTYLLRRCAEITLENGSRYFELRDTSSQTSTMVSRELGQRADAPARALTLHC